MRMPRHDGKIVAGFFVGGCGACGILNIAAATTADDRRQLQSSHAREFLSRFRIGLDWWFQRYRAAFRTEVVAEAK